jgi:hypothetical protein
VRGLIDLPTGKGYASQNYSVNCSIDMQ